MRYFIQFIFALALLAVVCWATWQGYLLLQQQQSGIPENLRSLVVITVIMILVVTYLLTSAIQYHGDQQRKSRQSLVRLELYEKFLSAWELTNAAITDSPGAQLQLNVQEFHGQLALIASGKVIKAYNDLQKGAAEQGVADSTTSAMFRNLILAMREDVGNSADIFSRRQIDQLKL